MPEIEYYRVDTDEKRIRMYGIIKVDVSLDGYVHWDGENELLDTENHEFEFDFKFNVREEQYSDSEISPSRTGQFFGVGHISYM